MQIDLAQGCPDHVNTDIAIIGAGAAGITAASRFIAAGREVTLIESGGVDYEKASADFNAGHNVGEPYYDLADARLRFFGGTTAIWGGRCAELDAIDFEPRPWVPHSGWPISLDDLKPWYAEARKLLDVGGTRNGREWIERQGLKELAVDHWSFDMRFDRFGYVARRSLIDHPRLTLLLHATLRQIVPVRSGQRVSYLDVHTPAGEKIRIEARTVILAAGGLENPRILLASKEVVPAGLGNQKDLVGRFFMEHPHARGGRVVKAPVWKLLNAFRQRRSGELHTAPLLKLDPELQRQRQVLNSALTLAARPPAGGSERGMKRIYLHARHTLNPTQAGRTVWKTYRRAGRAITKLTGPIAPWLSVVRQQKELAVVIRSEQAPNPDSRVTLNGEKDAVGMPRIQLDWRLQETEIRTASALVEALARDFNRLNLGKVDKAEWLHNGASGWLRDPLISSHPIGGYHHMGTTRMSNSPDRGVTDQWGRVHGMDNLYVCGSSVFPTSGWANPTLTIIALTLRTAEHILALPRAA